VTVLLLVRHGETDWNRDRRFQGHADPPLNENGRAQARELAGRLAGEAIAAVHASPLRRAWETAEIVAGANGLELTADEGLREVDLGSWSGLTRADVEARFPEGYRRWLAYGHGWDDGESYAELGDRVTRALVRIAAHHDGRPVLIVTHGGPIRSAVARASGLSHEEVRRATAVVENCDLVRLAVEAETFRLID
jgi:probable phosphoglycerate mutase